MPHGQAFLRLVHTSLVWATLLAAILSLALGMLVSRLLTARLARLTQAAQAIAGGDLARSPLDQFDPAGSRLWRDGRWSRARRGSAKFVVR